MVIEAIVPQGVQGGLALPGRKLPRARLEILPGTDHFFRRREREVAKIVARLALSIL